MNLDIGFTKERINTAYAPLAVMLARYREQHMLAGLAELTIPMRKRDFTPMDKLLQVAVSVLAGCETISEATPKLKSEERLAAVYGWPRFADQSMLSRMLDALTLKQIEQLRQSTTAIWRLISQARRHDWRSYLWLDFDLSGLPCSARAEASQKGYFSEKKRYRSPACTDKCHSLS